MEGRGVPRRENIRIYDSANPPAARAPSSEKSIQLRLGLLVTIPPPNYE